MSKQWTVREAQTWYDPRPDSDPDPWFHELFHRDLSPYRDEEVAAFRRLTGRGSVTP